MADQDLLDFGIYWRTGHLWAHYGLCRKLCTYMRLGRSNLGRSMCVRSLERKIDNLYTHNIYLESCMAL